MADEHDFILSPPRPDDALRRNAPSPRSFNSPRFEAVEGEIPPELSPLDAFAAQGRLLAKQLEGQSENGRRVSRLPPLTIAHSLAQARPAYLRSFSANPELPVERSVSPRRDNLNTHAPNIHLHTPTDRHVSSHPQLSEVLTTSGHAEPLPSVLSVSPSPLSREFDDVAGSSRPRSMPRTTSLSYNTGGREDEPVVRHGTPVQTNLDVVHTHHGRPRDASQDSLARQRSNTASPMPIKTSSGRAPMSIRSVPPDALEDEPASALDASLSSLPRKLSHGSGFSVSTPPRSPFIPPPPPRSPSLSSERSITFNGGRTVRGRTNFSRPLSRAGRPSLDTPSRQDSSDSQPGLFAPDDNVCTPVSMTSEEYFDASESAQAQTPAPAYIYSRFTLPRGRRPQRQSFIAPVEPSEQTSTGTQQQQSFFQGSFIEALPSFDQQPYGSTSPPQHETSLATRTASPTPLETNRSRSLSVGPGKSPIPGTQHGSATTPSPPRPQTHHQNRPTMTSAESQASTTTARRWNQSAVGSREISIEDHLNKGIECHEQGSLNESTYHLRIAAKANHPTAMLLYALACRHGWGMRPNPREGVQWLRRAADVVGLEFTDEDRRSESTPDDIAEMKTRRAQFALSIYELGVSHMNGWGIEQDKALALRCFEIAGGEFE